VLETLITNKTRVKLLIRFFMNPGVNAYLRGLEKEFGDSSNAIRIELNRFEEAGLIQSERNGNRKYYRANESYPLFDEVQKIAMKHFGVDRILDQVIEKLGEVKAVYLIGNLAKGLDTPIIDLALVGDAIDRQYLARLAQKAEAIVGRKIRCLVLSENEQSKIPLPKVLIYDHGDEPLKVNSKIS